MCRYLLLPLLFLALLLSSACGGPTEPDLIIPPEMQVREAQGRRASIDLAAVDWQAGPPLAGAAAPEAIFAESEVIELELSGPFAALNSAHDKELWKKAKLTLPEGAQGEAQELEVKIRQRGNIRFEICSFPGLTVKLPKRGAEASFGDMKTFKIVTHCDKNVRESVGIVARIIGDESSVFREAWVYRAWNLVSGGGHATRRARITYTDSETAKVMVKKAILLETHGWVAKRHEAKEGKAKSEAWIPRNRLSDLDPRSAALTHLFQIFVGNDDWILYDLNDPAPWRMRGSRLDEDIANIDISIYKLENMMVLEREGEWHLAEPFDWDLASMAAGYTPLRTGLRLNKDLFADRPEEFRRLLWLLQVKFRTRHSRPAINYAVSMFEQMRPDLEASIDAAGMDSEGEEQVRRRMQWFYEQIADDALFRATAAVEDAKLYADPAMAEVHCPVVHPGILMDIEEQRGDMVKIRILDDWPGVCRSSTNKRVWKWGWMKAMQVSRDWPPAASGE